jgi:hypothetical protein
LIRIYVCGRDEFGQPVFGVDPDLPFGVVDEPLPTFVAIVVVFLLAE